MMRKAIHIGSPTRIRIQNKQFIITGEDGVDHSRPIEDYHMLVLDHPQVSLTIPTLLECLTQNVSLTVCDERHLPLGVWMPLYANTMATHKTNSQLESSKPLKKIIWQKVIVSKIRNQALVMKRWGLPYKYLQEAANSVRSGDSSNIEGQAAAYYWRRLFPGQDFVRDRFGDFPNTMLNYGYAIIRAAVARCLLGAGLFLIMGINHKNTYNPLCLADDMMEPFRPFVDNCVKQLMGDGQNNSEHQLSMASRKSLLSILEMDVLIGSETKPMQLAMQSMCYSLSKCFEEGSGTQLKLPILQ